MESDGREKTHVVVLTWKHDIFEISWMSVGDGMLIGIPSSVAEIQTTHERDMTIDQTELLMMSPEQNGVIVHAIEAFQGITRKLGQLGGIESTLPDTVDEAGRHGLLIRPARRKNERRIRNCPGEASPHSQMVGMAEDLDVAGFVIVLEPVLGVGRGEGQGLGDFFVDDDVDLHAPLSRGEEETVEAILLELGGRTSEVQLGGKPPVSGNIISMGKEVFLGNITHPKSKYYAPHSPTPH
jgi:hypothetical protein